MKKLIACVSSANPYEMEIVKKYNLKLAPVGPMCHQFFVVKPDDRLTFQEAYRGGEENPMTGFSLPSSALGVCLHVNAVFVESSKGHLIEPISPEELLIKSNSLDEFLIKAVQ